MWLLFPSLFISYGHFIGHFMSHTFCQEWTMADLYETHLSLVRHLKPNNTNRTRPIILSLLVVGRRGRRIVVHRISPP